MGCVVVCGWVDRPVSAWRAQLYLDSGCAWAAPEALSDGPILECATAHVRRVRGCLLALVAVCGGPKCPGSAQTAPTSPTVVNRTLESCGFRNGSSGRRPPLCRIRTFRPTAGAPGHRPPTSTGRQHPAPAHPNRKSRRRSYSANRRPPTTTSPARQGPPHRGPDLNHYTLKPEEPVNVEGAYPTHPTVPRFQHRPRRSSTYTPPHLRLPHTPTTPQTRRSGYGRAGRESIATVEPSTTIVLQVISHKKEVQ